MGREKNLLFPELCVCPAMSCQVVGGLEIKHLRCIGYNFWIYVFFLHDYEIY